MSNEQGESGDGSGVDDEHPLKLAVDINDWEFAGRHLLRLLVRLGGRIPPPDAGAAAELAQLVAHADAEFARFVEVWETCIRPRLKKYEDAPIPPLTFL